MKHFDLSFELTKKLNSKRLRSWRWSTAAANIKKSLIDGFVAIKKPELGDLALVQVISIGAHSAIEEPSGNRLAIFPGSIFVGAFASRYAADEFEGVIPDALDDSLIVDLLNVGGTIGKVVSKNSRISGPTKLKVLAFLKDKSGNVANTLNYPLRFDTAKVTTAPKNNIKLILVVGTAMNSGKSNTAKAIIYALTTSGKNVVAGKVTGTAAKKDSLLMKSAGAIEVCDFTSFGYPSTYLISEKELFSLYYNVYNYLSSKCDSDGYIVLEIADGILQRETDLLLSDKSIISKVDFLIFSSCDSLSAVAGIEKIENKFDIKVSAISGPAANSSLGLKEIRSFFNNIPVFDNMILDVGKIAKVFQDVGREDSKSLNIQVIPEAVV